MGLERSHTSKLLADFYMVCMNTQINVINFLTFTIFKVLMLEIQFTGISAPDMDDYSSNFQRLPHKILTIHTEKLKVSGDYRPKLCTFSTIWGEGEP